MVTSTVTKFDILTKINSVLIDAMEAPNQLALQFVIANETRKVIPYDRAILCQIVKKKITPISISGQSAISTLTEFHRGFSELINNLSDPGGIQMLSQDKFSTNQDIWTEYQRKNAAAVLWLPIYSKGELSLGLWVEQWEATQENMVPQATLDLVSEHLLPGLGAIWDKYRLRARIKPAIASKYKYIVPLLGSGLLSLFLIHLPLRVVAPCEIVPKDPTIITAPLQGVIEKIDVLPGDFVKVGNTLVQYDKRLYARELKIAQHEYLIGEATLSRALALGINDKTSLQDVEILRLKSQKQKIDLERAKDNYKKSEIHSPINGTVIMNNPDEWVGKPVQIGEKILTIADLSNTKVKIWLPEDDHIELDRNTPVTVVSNAEPEKKLSAHITYVGNEVMISDQNIPSFIVEADWEGTDRIEKTGLKGTAVLYGEKVSLFYYLFRKPWIIFRHIFGPLF